MTDSEISAVLSELSSLYPSAEPALHFSSPYELLVAVMLSAQCTDERVNKVTPPLFAKYDTPQKMLTLTQAELEKYIFSCGFYHEKAKHILSASRDVIEKFSGKVPNTVEQLMLLAGVGRKTANVVYAVAFGGDAIAVDTHVFRVSNRLGLCDESTVERTESALCAAIPKNMWSRAHHLLIYHGRSVCFSRKPACETCALNKLCKYYNQSNG